MNKYLIQSLPEPTVGFLKYFDLLERLLRLEDGDLYATHEGWVGISKGTLLAW